MKNCDEMVNSLFERREQYMAEQKKKRKAVAGAAISACCVCLIALLGFSLWRGGESGQEIGRVPLGSGSTPNTPETNDFIYIEQVEKLPENNQRMNIALMMDDFVPMSRDEINEYYGVNIFPTVPSDLAGKEADFGIFKRKGTGEVYWDGNRVDYCNENFSRAVSVNVDKDCVPFDFCNLFDEPESKSVIDNVEVGIAQTPYGEFYAEFMLEGAGFRVFTSGLTQDELVKIVSSLIQ